MSANAQVQYGGQIRGQNNSAAIDVIKRNGDALKVSDSIAKVVLDLINGKLPSNLTVTSTRLLVDGSGVTQPISGTITIGTFPDNEPFNVAQINGVTPLMGAGNGGTGSLRVNIASDQVAIPVTLTSTTITGTVAVTKSGTWDITNAGTFATQPASATAPVSTMNSASANSGLNSALAGVFDDVTPTAITENSFGFLRMSANRNLFGTIRDAAGNERGANVNASNEMLVAVSSIPSHAVTNAGTFVTQIDGAALTALQLIDNLPNTLGSTTSGQSGALALGAVTTAAPSYTTAQTNALSLTTAGALRVDNSAVTQPVSGTVSITANSAVNVAQINGVTPLMGNGTTGTGSQRVTLASDMTAISTTGYMSVKFDQTTPGTTNGVSLVPTTTGGLTTYHLVSAASTNATNIKASAGQLYGYYIFNANAAARKVAFHNSASTPTAGASVFFSVVIPASSGANVEFSQGLAFSSGIGITTVTGTADSDATAVASGDLIINLFYK